MTEVKLEDVVAYHDLTPGKTYTLSGVLMDKATGKPVLVDGKQVTAETSFKPEESDGSVTVTFIFNASGLGGKDVVVFETLYRDGDELAVHADINDEGQTVRVHKPEIGTKATVEGQKEVDPFGEINLVDTVEYHDLTPGKEYKMTGVLMDKEIGKPLLIDGKQVTAASVFTPEKADGTVDVTFTFNVSGLAGKEIVAFESLYRDDLELAVHAEIDDDDQTVRVRKPEIGTTAAIEGQKEVDPIGEIKLVDTVEYHDLTPGKTYTLSGVLMDKMTGEPLLIDGEQVLSSAMFTPQESSGTVDVTFTFDVSALAGKEIVAFETLSREGVQLAVHTDIEDEGQTVRVRKPDIGTTATADGGKEVDPLTEVKLEDVVAYHDLTPGKTYTVSGVLMDKATGNPILIDGKQVTSEALFIPETADGSVTVTFSFNASGLGGKDIVVFETLYRDGNELAVHADINDEGQTVRVRKPDIGTTATADGTKEVDPLDEINLVDTVEYHDLTPGKEYKVTGVLMDKATGDPVLIDGKQVTAASVFTPEKADGTVDVTFTFNASGLAGKEIVAFETLSREGVQLAVHAEIDDDDQTVRIRKPDIGTTATVGGEKEAKATEKVVLEDVVEYHDLTPGREYTLTGVLMNKETGEPFLADGKQVTSQTTFTPKDTDGSVTVTFVFNGLSVTRETDVVAFETLSRDGDELVVHADIEDEDQTVTLKPSKGKIKLDIDIPKTGDTRTFLPLILIAAASGAALLGLLLFCVIRKKRGAKMLGIALFALCAAMLVNVAKPMPVSADEAGSKTYTQTQTVVTEDPDSAADGVTFPDQIVQDGVTYNLSGVENKIVSETPNVEEQTAVVTETRTVGNKNAEMPEAVDRDGLHYVLGKVDYKEKQISDLTVELYREVDLGTAVSEPDAAATHTVTYHLDAYDLDVDVPLPLQDVIQTGSVWQDDVRMPMTVIGVNTEVLDFEGTEISFDGSTPPLAGNEDLFLRYFSLSPDSYRLTGAEWNGGVYEDADGVPCRNATVYGERLMHSYTARYGGTAVAVPAFTAYDAEATYTAETTVETGTKTYEILFTANYTEAPAEGLSPVWIGAAIGVLALLLAVVIILAVLAKKKKKAKGDAPQWY